MNRPRVEGQKRCPICNSTKIYKRLRKEYHKIKDINIHRNHDMKTYICLSCKYEFDVPFVKKVMIKNENRTE